MLASMLNTLNVFKCKRLCISQYVCILFTSSLLYRLNIYTYIQTTHRCGRHTHTQPYFHRYFDKAMLLLGFARCDEVITNNINCYCEWYFIYLCLPMCCWLFSSTPPQQTHLTHARTKVYKSVCVFHTHMYF